DVERHRGGLPARRRDGVHGLGQLRLVARAEHDRRPGGAERLRDAASDAPRRARHEHDLAGHGEGGRHAVCASWSAAAAAASDAGSSTLSTRAARSIFLTRPESTAPGPTSTNVDTPSARIRSTAGCQSTGAETWRTRPSRHSAAVRTTRASTLL